ncbi:MAG: S-layer homology domain-containing protein [Paenibacillaceae bacterium]|nr:S-layer homology domain-containing protein [Paenibacillaceae bacterium]
MGITPTKKAFVVLLAASMISGGAAYAETTTGSAANPAPATSVTSATGASLKTGFPDVASTYWGIKHITKLAVEGIVQGDETGRFNPDNQVSQQDVIIMAIRMMGLEPEAQQIKTESYTLPPLEVRPDALPYIIEAQQKQLLNFQEETDNGKLEGKGWGNRPASREWVAKVVIRMLDMQSEAEQLANEAVTFADGSQISAWAKGFINKAVELHIVEGFDGNVFKPKDPVTRAQMATFMSRAETYLDTPSPRVRVGVVTEYSSSSISIVDADGKKTAYSLAGDVSYFTAASDKDKKAASDIKLYSQVYILQNNGIAYYVEMTKEDAQWETVTGVYDSMDLPSLQIKLKVDGELKSYGFIEGVAILDNDGIGSSLIDLERNSIIELRRTTFGGGTQYSQIIIKEKPVNKTAEGIVQTIDAAGGKLGTMDEDGTIGTFPLAADAELTYKDKKLAGLAELHTGDKIVYVVESGEIVTVDVVKMNVEITATGQYYQHDGMSLTIQTANKKLSAYFLADNLPISIPGVAMATLDDLYDGDELKLTLDDDDNVTKIVVLSRTVRHVYSGEIKGFIPEESAVTVTENGQLSTYKLTDDSVVVGEDGEEAPAGATLDSLYAKGKKLDLFVTKENTIIKVQLASQYEGTIAAINAKTSELSLTTGDGQTIKLKLTAQPLLEIPNAPLATLASFAAGDKVLAKLSAAQDAVTSLQLEKTVMLRLVGKDAAAGKIVAKNELGVRFEYTLSDDVSLTTPDKQDAALADLPLDEAIHATFVGKTIGKVASVASVRGKVLAIAPDGSSLSVQQADGIAVSVAVGAKANVYRNGALSTSLLTVKPEERVELAAMPDGGYMVTVAAMTERGFSSYNAATGEVKLLISNLGDQSLFMFHEDSYLHAGTSPLALNSLVSPDWVRIYTIDSKIIELEKL